MSKLAYQDNDYSVDDMSVDVPRRNREKFRMSGHPSSKKGNARPMRVNGIHRRRQKKILF